MEFLKKKNVGRASKSALLNVDNSFPKRKIEEKGLSWKKKKGIIKIDNYVP